MALSDKTKEIMVVALANKKAGEELAEAVDQGTASVEDAEAFADAASDSADAAAASAADAEAAADAIDAAATGVADIADPSTASAEDVANKVNELLAALRAIS